MKQYIEVAQKVLTNNIHLKSDETITIVTDDTLTNIGHIFYEASRSLAKEACIVQMQTRSKSGEEPPAQIARAMEESDVNVCITEHSLTHTNARKQASKKGSRVITMPGLTIDMLKEGAITADYAEVEELTEKYCQLLEDGMQVKIEKDHATLSFSIAGRSAIASTGVFRHPGDSGNLPSGESFIAPIEDSANGQIIIDGAISGIGVLKEPTKLTIKDGRLIDATGEAGQKLLELLGDGDGRTIAEFGIGTNKAARLTGNVLEDEKVYGTIHVAFGSNHSFGGQTEAGVHIDCVVKNPLVWIDESNIFES